LTSQSQGLSIFAKRTGKAPRVQLDVCDNRTVLWAHESWIQRAAAWLGLCSTERWL